MFRCKPCGALNNVKAGAEGSPVCGRCKVALDVTGAPQEVDAAELTRTLEASTVPVLVDFWAPWCGPCRAAAPAVDQVSRENAGRFLALKLNTDQNQAAASGYGIQGIPTFIVFQGGRVLGRRSGAMAKTVLAGWVAQVTAAAPGP